MKKKALISIGSLLVVYLLLGSSALAFFLPQVRMTGMEMRTTDLKMLVSLGLNHVFYPTINLHGAVTLRPGMEPFMEQFAIRNNSDGGQQMDLEVQFEGGTGDWDTLKDLITLEFVDQEMHQSSGWKTLAQWREQKHPLPTPHLTETQARLYEMHYDFADTYPYDPDGTGPLVAGSPIGNEMMGKAITGLTLVIHGTENNP